MGDDRPMLAGCSVLVLEDEYLLGSDLKDALIALGAEVIGPIPDIDSARAQISEGGFDVAIIDVNLGGHETYGIADELQRAGVPFLLSTGYSEKVVPVRFRAIIRWEQHYDMARFMGDVGRLYSAAMRIRDGSSPSGSDDSRSPA
jgi:hypothetical protein